MRKATVVTLTVAGVTGAVAIATAKVFGKIALDVIKQQRKEKQVFDNLMQQSRQRERLAALLDAHTTQAVKYKVSEQLKIQVARELRIVEKECLTLSDQMGDNLHHFLAIAISGIGDDGCKLCHSREWYSVIEDRADLPYTPLIYVVFENQDAVIWVTTDGRTKIMDVADFYATFQPAKISCLSSAEIAKMALSL